MFVEYLNGLKDDFLKWFDSFTSIWRTKWSSLIDNLRSKLKSVFSNLFSGMFDSMFSGLNSVIDTYNSNIAGRIPGLSTIKHVVSDARSRASVSQITNTTGSTNTSNTSNDNRQNVTVDDNRTINIYGQDSEDTSDYINSTLDSAILQNNGG